jgi:hypothetical protein
MSVAVITNQTELDTALADADVHRIEIRSERGVWLQLRPQREVSVVAWGSSSVEAWGSSSVEAWDSSSVVAWDSSSVVAWDSSSVEAWDSSSVEAWDSSSVEARDSSSVEARDSSSVEARDSSSVEAWDSSSVEARGSSSVEARGAAGVHAWHRSKTRAGSSCAVWLHQATATIEGGHLIDLTQIDLDNTETWLAHHGVTVTDGRAMLYKAVDDELVAGHGHRPTSYVVGTDVEAPDWRDDRDCGHGLHVSPHPLMARDYYPGAKRYLRCSMAVTDIRVIDGTGSSTPKCKVPRLRVEAEVDRHGRDLVAQPEAVPA